MSRQTRARSATVAWTDPDWQAMKSARRSFRHDAAVQESFFLLKQFRALWSGKMTASPVDLNRILRTLTRKKIPFVLTGAHAIGGWTGRPRDTHDIDLPNIPKNSLPFAFPRGPIGDADAPSKSER